MPGIRAILSAFVAATCGLALAACGSDEEGSIPRDDGELLLTQLERIEDQVRATDCEAARVTAAEFAQAVDELPSEVSGELRQALVEASANLERLSNDPEQCAPEGATGATGVEEPVEPIDEPTTTTDETTTDEDTDDDEDNDDRGGGRGNGPPDRPQGGDDGNPPGNSGDNGSSGGIGSNG